MEVKGKARPVALSLLINTSSETPSTASGSGTEKGMSFHFGRSVCGYRANLAAGMEGGVQLELGWVGEPMGL